MPERRELRGRPQLAGDKGRTSCRIDRFARDAHRGSIDIADPLAKAVLAQDDAGCAEGIGDDHVRPRLEIGAVDRRDDVGPRQVQDFADAGVPSEIFGHKARSLHHRSHRTVEDRRAGKNVFSKTAHSAQHYHDCPEGASRPTKKGDNFQPDETREASMPHADVGS